ncbi:extracellular serine/threonine protein kinase four-jointed-like [Symsagittifera roscoffensis]|uniref:extracellular serine/threonine protein kinase four-jointed-like n=1 Tax=Symsagittifera roscoffensis TaxID=84072 RepID=UPI00307C5CC1
MRNDNMQSDQLNLEEWSALIFFPSKIMKRMPQGFSNEEFKQWKDEISRSRVVGVEKGCGRMKNRLLHLEGGGRVCCRYRQNQDQIQGEVFSFYLSRAIGINKVAPTKLSVFNASDPFWSDVAPQLLKNENEGEGGWEEGKLVILTKFIDYLHPVNIPLYFQTDQNSVADWSTLASLPTILSNQSSVSLNSVEIAELAQWSDMVVFDYLTANLDRVVNNLNNLKWNSRMLQYPIHNLQQRNSDNLYLLFDNESGLLHSYRILDKFSHYHDQLLSSVCLFSPQTVANIERHASNSSLWSSMYQDFQAEESLSRKLPKLPSRFVSILHSRLNSTREQFAHCETRLKNNK